MNTRKIIFLSVIPALLAIPSIGWVYYNFFSPVYSDKATLTLRLAEGQERGRILPGLCYTGFYLLVLYVSVLTVIFLLKKIMRKLKLA